MVVRRLQETADRRPRPMDWAVIGARVLEAAGVASMVHQAERVSRALGQEWTCGPPVSGNLDKE